MERERYFQLTSLLAELSRELAVDLADDRRPLSTEFLLYGLFDIVPDYKFLGENYYHKAADKQAFKTECRDITEHFLVTRYRSVFKGKDKEVGELLVRALFDNDLALR